MKWTKHKSLAAFIICCLALTVWMFASRQHDHILPEADITWDASGYYLYLPGFFYDDLGEMHNLNYIANTYHPGGLVNSDSWRGPKGKFVIKYSAGMAIMSLPGFIAGHFFAWVFHYPRDGFSYPYTASLGIYSLLISFLGLWLIRKVLLVYFTDGVTALGVLSICLATNYFTFAAYDNMLTHSDLFTVYAAILFTTQKFYQKPNWKKAAALGGLCGLAVLTRPTEIICVLVPGFWATANLGDLKQRAIFFKQHFGNILIFGICAALLGSIQLIYWKIYSGHFIYWSYGADEGFNFLHVHVHDCLFSYKKGWLTYTPFMALSLVGFIPLYFQQKKIFWPLLVFSFLALYITFAWKCWWYGGSFSMRAVVQYYAVLIFPVCAVISFSLRRVYTAALFGSFLLFCIWLNITMSYQADISYIMECDNMSKAYFWKIFGKLHAQPFDRRLIDCPDELPEKLVPTLGEIGRRDYSNDSLKTNYSDEEGRKALTVGKGIQFSPALDISVNGKNKGWFRATADIFIENSEPDYWLMPTFYVSLTDGRGKEIKRNFYRIQRITPERQWTEIPIDIKIPAGAKPAKLTAGLASYSGNKAVLIDEIKAYYTAGDK